MEVFTLLLTSLVTLVSPAGWLTDRWLAKALRSPLADVEVMAVRIDHRPSHQLLRGQVDRLRVAGRGLYPWPDWRIDTLEVETDPVRLDLSQLQRERSTVQAALRDPLQGGIRLVLNEADLNQALNSPDVRSQLQHVINQAVSRQFGDRKSIEISAIQLNFLAPNRLAVQLQVRQVQALATEASPLLVELEVGFQVNQGRSLQLINLQGAVNGRRLSSRLLQGFADGLGDRLDLRPLETSGILVRLLQLEIDAHQLRLVAFVRLDPLHSETDALTP